MWQWGCRWHNHKHIAVDESWLAFTHVLTSTKTSKDQHNGLKRVGIYSRSQGNAFIWQEWADIKGLDILRILTAHERHSYIVRALRKKCAEALVLSPKWPMTPFQLLIFFIITKGQKKIYRWKATNISPFLLSNDRSFLQMWTGKTNMYSFLRPILSHGTTSAARVYVIDL